MNPKLRKSIRLYGIMLICIVLLAAVLAAIYFISEQNVFGMILCIAVALTAVFAIFGYLAFRRTIRDKIINDSVSLANREMQYMQNWNHPYAIFTEEGRIIWANEQFQEQFHKIITVENDERLSDLIGLYKTPDKAGPVKSEIELLDNDWEMVLEQEILRDAETNKISETLYSISLRNITREKMLETENFNIRPVAALIYIDNYDQAMGSIEETHRPMLEAMVYSRLNDLTANLKGILTRIEKDRLSLIFPHETLGRLRETKFKVLDDVRQIRQGNRIPVTLSMGVGSADTLSESYAMAQTAVDLALGRGGDQAVLKDKTNTVFFGGRSSGVEKTTRVRARLIAGNLNELIADADQVLIMGHAKPDMDCYGAALGLLSCIAEFGKSVHLVLGPNHPAIDRLYARVMADPDFSKKVVTPSKAEELSGPKTLLIVVDVNRPTIVEAPALLEKNENVVVIDHHRVSVDNIQNPLISYVEPYASSASEMVAELIQYLSDRKVINPLIADALFAGIALDTKNFIVKTGIRTFDAAAYLRRCGADSQRVRQLFKNEMGEYKIKSRIISNAEVFREKFALSWWDGRNTENSQAVAAAASDELLEILGIEASFVLTQMEEYIAVSARSTGEQNVQIIMEKLGGGGHLNMAGAQLRVPMEEALTLVQKAIAEYIAE